MKNMRKITALLLALAMVFAMTLSVSAAGNGTITINAATVGETYKIYKIFDATTQNGNTAYTFTKTVDNDALYTALSGENSPFTLTATAGDANKFNVSLKEGKIGSEVAVFLKSIEEKMGTAVATKEADSTTVVFENLDYGYYYIAKASTEQPGPTVGVTSVAPAQTINDKSTKPGEPDPGTDPEDPSNPGYYKILVGSDGKYIGSNENTANYGDTVYFVLQAKATNYDDGKKIVEYTAYDLLGEGFKDFSVTKVTVNGTVITNYSVDSDASPITVTIPWTDASGNHLYAPTAAIKIYCQAVVDEDAIIGETDENTANTTNTGWFGWEYDTTKPDPENPDGPEIPETGDGYNDKKTVITKVYAIAIYKTDSKGNALEGANFEIYDANGNKVPVTETSEGSGIYKYDSTSTNYTVVSPASGMIVIKGLEGVDYVVKETVAPAGYNLVTEGITIEATEFSNSTTTLTLYYDENDNLTDTTTDTKTEVTFDVASAAINVINLTGAELPSTGGMGTTLFYAFGSVLVLAAVVLLVTKKRMAI